jgi:hypothetical protein
MRQLLAPQRLVVVAVVHQQLYLGACFQKELKDQSNFNYQLIAI